MSFPWWGRSEVSQPRTKETHQTQVACNQAVCGLTGKDKVDMVPKLTCGAVRPPEIVAGVLARDDAPARAVPSRRDGVRVGSGILHRHSGQACKKLVEKGYIGVLG